jgi:hypothetical protein
MTRVTLKLFEDSAGSGELSRNGQGLGAVTYRIRRFQGVTEGSGLPIPGMHRIEGAIQLESGDDVSEWIGAPLTLRLSDGRTLGVTFVDASGRVLSEGHGPSKCMCC